MRRARHAFVGLGPLLVPLHGGHASAVTRPPTAHRAPQATAPVRASTARKVDSVVQFRLPDQFGRVYDAAEYRGRRFYVVAAGSGGRSAATAWGTMLPRALAAGADPAPAADTLPAPVVLVADLRGVPRWLRGLVRGRFPHARRDAVLLDWTGALAVQLALDPARCTVVAVSPAGRPMLRLTTLSADTAEVAAFVRRADAAMVAAGPRGGA